MDTRDGQRERPHRLAPRWGLSRGAGWVWITLCTASHSLRDMLTNGGIGIAFLWPVAEARFFSPWRPIEVSPVSIQRFLSPRGIQVILNEVVTVWAPMLALASAVQSRLIVAIRRRGAAQRAWRHATLAKLARPGSAGLCSAR
ncbi:MULTISPECIES: metal-dependent hydrolase [Variovorax]|uniref:metal-dependent hydrolase n=1 Tax=Variovorax TaxID=34072 RepID=UPI00286B409B|nr:metal-dependent hydrolase [Variovorax sp. 3319]